jgi:hypothetical protein
MKCPEDVDSNGSDQGLDAKHYRIYPIAGNPSGVPTSTKPAALRPPWLRRLNKSSTPVVWSAMTLEKDSAVLTCTSGGVLAVLIRQLETLP